MVSGRESGWWPTARPLPEALLRRAMSDVDETVQRFPVEEVEGLHRRMDVGVDLGLESLPRLLAAQRGGGQENFRRASGFSRFRPRWWDSQRRSDPHRRRRAPSRRRQSPALARDGA
jgi:hypothetical protein